MIHTLEPVIKEHPVFKGLEESHIQLIVGCARNLSFRQDEMLFREGEEATGFYVIREGLVAVELVVPNRGPVTVQTVSEGDVLGFSWLLPPYHSHFDARALVPTRAFAFDGKCIRQKCETDHYLGYELMKRFSTIMAQRLDATRLQLLDMYGDHA